MTPSEVVTETFELCAAAEIDLTPAVYQTFFTSDPQAMALMGHSDAPMRGRMLDEALVLIMSEPTADNDRYLQWEVENHLLAYGVALTMYEGFFVAIRDAVRDALASRWQTAHEQGWNARIEQLQSAVATKAQLLGN